MKQCVVLLALAALGGLTNLADAAVLNAPGVLVDGFGKHVFKQCSTCPDEGSSDGDTQGGDGVDNATTSGAGNGFLWLASATLVGPNALPVLKARAETVNPSQGLGLVSANAIAQGLQAYHYAGTEDGSYTITFTVDGSLTGDDESIDAGIFASSSKLVSGADGPVRPRLSQLARVTKSARTTPGAFSDSNSITFNVGAGEDFFVQAFLIANAFFVDAGSLQGVADASHTFTASFTAGDVSLLRTFASLPAQVPEPATFGMALAGLVALGLIRGQYVRPNRITRGRHAE